MRERTSQPSHLLHHAGMDPETDNRTYAHVDNRPYANYRGRHNRNLNRTHMKSITVRSYVRMPLMPALMGLL